MTFFDETKAYWGNQTAKIIGAGNNRLTARSVKIFADGAYDAAASASPLRLTRYQVHCGPVWRRYATDPRTCDDGLNLAHSCMSHILTTRVLVV